MTDTPRTAVLRQASIPTLLMFPVLAYVYARLARSEEREVAAAFGTEWTAYAERVHPYRPHRPLRQLSTTHANPYPRSDRHVHH